MIQRNPKHTKTSCTCFVTFKTFEKSMEPRQHFVTLETKNFTTITKDFFDNTNLLRFAKVTIFLVQES